MPILINWKISQLGTSLVVILLCVCVMCDVVMRQWTIIKVKVKDRQFNVENH